MKFKGSYARDAAQNLLDLADLSVFELENTYLQSITLRIPGLLGLVDIINVSILVIAVSSGQGNGVQGFFQVNLIEVDGDLSRDFGGRGNVDPLLHGEGRKGIPDVSVNQAEVYQPSVRVLPIPATFTGAKWGNELIGFLPTPRSGVSFQLGNAELVRFSGWLGQNRADYQDQGHRQAKKE
jgi:hypothetical protein